LLIGRAAAQRRIDELWERARTGTSETLVLVGEPSDFDVVRALNTGSAAQI
jgi:hypothetical protein